MRRARLNSYRPVSVLYGCWVRPQLFRMLHIRQRFEQQMQSISDGARGRGASFPTNSTSSALSTVSTCDTFTTLAFSRLASPFFRATFPGALALLRFDVIRHTTLVPIALRLTSPLPDFVHQRSITIEAAFFFIHVRIRLSPAVALPSRPRSVAAAFVPADDAAGTRQQPLQKAGFGSDPSSGCLVRFDPRAAALESISAGWSHFCANF